MVIKQISVFLENKAGRLAKVAEALKDNGINIRALTIADTSDFGILRMVVNKPEAAYETLKKAGFTVKESGVIAIEMDDRPGVFFEIMSLCDRKNLNVEYAYSFVEQYSSKAVLFLRFESPEAAIDVFKSGGYKLLTDTEIRKL
jgi:hypothetical protein